MLKQWLYCGPTVLTQCKLDQNANQKLCVAELEPQSCSNLHSLKVGGLQRSLFFFRHMSDRLGVLFLFPPSGAPVRRGKPKPPLSLSANQSSAGIVLQWSPPEAQHPTVSAFVLQSRTEQGEWINLDENISANRSEIVVPGLHKVKSNAQCSLWDESDFFFLSRQQ